MVEQAAASAQEQVAQVSGALEAGWTGAVLAVAEEVQPAPTVQVD